MTLDIHCGDSKFASMTIGPALTATRYYSNLMPLRLMGCIRPRSRHRMTNDGNPCGFQGDEGSQFYSRQQLKTASG